MNTEELDDLGDWVTIGYPVSGDERLYKLEEELIALSKKEFDMSLEDLVVWGKGALGNDTTDVVGLTFTKKGLENFGEDYKDEIIKSLSSVIKGYNKRPMTLS